MTRQGDLFASDQGGFAEDAPTPIYRADPEDARRELHRLLALARQSQSLPWDTRQTSYYRTVFPQMANWLPDDEAAQLRSAFAAELARLEAA